MASSPLDWADLMKVAIPALGAWGATWLSNRRERRVWTEKQEEKQQQLLTSQSDRLAAGWSEMTTQAREIIARLQVETIDAKTRAATAEERNANLRQELDAVRQKYSEALHELEELRERGKRRAQVKTKQGVE